MVKEMKMTPNDKREITVAQKEVERQKRFFEEHMAEARKWSDQNLWIIAADRFEKAARKAKDVASVQAALERLLQAADRDATAKSLAGGETA
jgi:hypothetical protein